MEARALGRVAIAALCVFFAGCGGGSGTGGTTIPGALSNSPTRVTPEFQPTPAPNEELLILVNSCNANASLQCVSHSSTIKRYALSTGAALPTIHLQDSTCGGGGAYQTVASAGDQYFLSYELDSSCQWRVEVDGLNGSTAYFSPKGGTLLTSTDLSSVLATGYQTTQVYRAPFTTASRTSTLFGTATNSNGSVVFEPGSNGNQMTLAIESLVTGQTTTVSWNSGGVSPFSGPFTLYDARHALVYFLAGNAKVVRLMIVDTAHDKFVGYANVPAAGGVPVMSIDPTSSDVYVLMVNNASNVHSNVYVYNFAACGCITPRRVLAMPFGTDNITIDPNGRHLIASDRGVVNGGNVWHFHDLNPQSGAVQRTYPPISSNNNPVFNTVYTVLAQ